jgi:hypothetical protein
MASANQNEQSLIGLAHQRVWSQTATKNNSPLGTVPRMNEAPEPPQASFSVYEETLWTLLYPPHEFPFFSTGL